MTKLMALIEKHRGLALLFAGGISATGFAPLDLWPLALLCLALLMHLVARAESGRRAFLLGWLFGLGHFTIGNNWIATAFTFQANMPAWLGWLAVPLLALYLAVYPGLAALGGWWMLRISNSQMLRHPREGGGPSPIPDFVPTSQEMDSRLRGNDEAKVAERRPVSLVFILTFAACWIITEWLRSWVFTGFAWNPLGAVGLDTMFAQIWLPIIGTYGFSGLVAFAAGALALLPPWFARNRASGSFSKSGSWVVAAFVAVFGLPLALFSLFPNAIIGNKPNAQPTGTALTIVQPNISQIDRNAVGYEAVNFSRLAQNSRPKSDEPRILFWPESAVPWWLEDGYPPYAYLNQPGASAAATRRSLARLLGPGDMLLTGSDRLEFDRSGEVVGARNAVLAIDATGTIKARYDKAHLVPFGEYLALRWLLEPLGATRLVPGSLDFWPGPGPRTLRLGADRPDVGVQICYEIIFSGKVVDRAKRPDFIFNPSNDAWFGSWGPPQHLAQARLRAIEEGLPVVRSTPTGISAVIDADGRALESLALGKAGRIDASLPKATAPTLFARLGNILPLGFAALLIAVAFLPLVRSRISR